MAESSESLQFLPKRHRLRWGVGLGLVALSLAIWASSRWLTGRPPSEPFGLNQAMPVKLETTQTAVLENFSEFLGRLESEQSVSIQPDIEGRVSRILVRAGDQVQAGAPLVQLKPDQQAANFAGLLASVASARAARTNAQAEIEALQAERVARQAEVDLQQENYRRIAGLVADGALPQQQGDQVMRDIRAAKANLIAIDRRIGGARANLREVEAGLTQAKANASRANAELSETLVVAPFAGTVGDIPVKLGQVVDTEDVLTTLTQNQVLDLRLSVPAEQARQLQLGLPVLLINDQNDLLQRGKISFIAPDVDPRAQTVLVKASFDNPNGKLRNGEFVKARIIWQKRPGLLIPATAIVRQAGEPFVYVAVPGQASGDKTTPPGLIAQLRPIQLGKLQGNRFQVLSGLSAGDRLVVSGTLNLQDGATIQPLSGASTQPPRP
jgi:RND family efflux transporter MFP subunit